MSEKDEKKTFWRKWIEADDVRRLEMVRSLTPFNRGAVCRYMTATLLNSYIKDFYDEMKK